MSRQLGILLLCMCCHINLVAQGVFATTAHIGDTTTVDFVLGECNTFYTAPAAVGFLPSLYYSYISSEKQLTDNASIQVHYDNILQQATIFMAYELTLHRPKYIVCGNDGKTHLQGEITSMPHFIDYRRLPAGLYLLYIYGIPQRIPHITRWLKQ